MAAVRRGWLLAAASLTVVWSAANTVVVVSLVNTSAATAEDLRQATCPFNRELASAPIPPNTGELGRRLVRDAAAAYQRVCVPTFGPLPPVDPDAYRVAPSPTPTPSPTR